MAKTVRAPKGTVAKATVKAEAAAPEAVVVSAPTAIAALAHQLVSAPEAPKAPVVAVRGGLAIATVKLTGKAYRVGCPHNAAWWQQCVQAIDKETGTAAVADRVKAGVPAIFVGYVVRRGYMAAA